MAAEGVLEQAIHGVADGAAVNWGVLQRLARSDDERSELKWLQVLGAIADVHKSAHGELADEASEITVAAPAGATSLVPETWNRYRLVRKLGSGSFGSVYCAWDSELERSIAIKILHEQVDDAHLRERLLREGRALARVQHTNVVQVFGVELHGSRVGLCMELVSGETLAAVLRSHGVLSHREAAVVGEDVCRALAAVHAAGFVHRDVKAQNVMRDKAGKIVLMDFGTGHDTAGRGGPRDIVGTPAYMAPEVLDGRPASVQSDVYAVGVLMYHLVTGQYPVEGGTLLDLDRCAQGRAPPAHPRTAPGLADVLCPRGVPGVVGGPGGTLAQCRRDARGAGRDQAGRDAGLAQDRHTHRRRRDRRPGGLHRAGDGELALLQCRTRPRGLRVGGVS